MATDATLAGLLALCRAVNQQEDRALAESSELGDLKCTPKTVSVQQSVIQQAIVEQRRELTGSDWRASAQWLKKQDPEAFGTPEITSTELTKSLEPACSVEAEAADLLGINTPAAEGQCTDAAAPESTSGAAGSTDGVTTSDTIPAVKLPLAQWFDRFIGYGANSRVVALAEVIACVRLVVAELQGPLAAAEAKVELATEFVAVPALYAECARLTGNAAPWGIVQELQLKARMQQGIPAPSFQLALPIDGAGQPRCMQELNEPGGTERDWMIENGLWCA